MTSKSLALVVLTVLTASLSARAHPEEEPGDVPTHDPGCEGCISDPRTPNTPQDASWGTLASISAVVTYEEKSGACKPNPDAGEEGEPPCTTKVPCKPRLTVELTLDCSDPNFKVDMWAQGPICGEPHIDQPIEFENNEVTPFDSVVEIDCGSFCQVHNTYTFKPHPYAGVPWTKQTLVVIDAFQCGPCIEESGSGG